MDTREGGDRGGSGEERRRGKEETRKEVVEIEICFKVRFSNSAVNSAKRHRDIDGGR